VQEKVIPVLDKSWKTDLILPAGKTSYTLFLFTFLERPPFRDLQVMPSRGFYD